MVAGQNPLTEARLAELDPALTFTAVTIPNPHLVAAVDKYVEADLVAMGERVAARPDVFPAGANLSVLLPLGPDEVFVRTFERGAGLTASCGSGMAASRAVWSRIGEVDPEREVLDPQRWRHRHGVAGGPGRRLAPGRQRQRHARLPSRNRPGRPRPQCRAKRRHGAAYDEEERAYAALEKRNATRLREAGVETAP